MNERRTSSIVYCIRDVKEALLPLRVCLPSLPLITSPPSLVAEGRVTVLSEIHVHYSVPMLFVIYCK